MSTRVVRLVLLALVCWSPCTALAAPVYVALGASDALGVGASNFNPSNPTQPNNGYVYRIHDGMRARYAPWQLVNLGISNATITVIRDNALDAAIARQPSLVTVWAGGNDVKDSVLAGETTEVISARFEAALDTILGRLRRETGAFIVTANLPDMSRLPIAAFLPESMRQLGKADSLALNAVIARVAAKYDVPVVDLYNAPESYNPLSYSSDGFHPSDAGYAAMALAFEAVLERDAWRIVSGLGDVDGNGTVDFSDAAEALRAAGGMAAPGERAAMAADTSPAGGDGSVTLADALRLLHRTQARIPDAEWR